MTNDTTGKTSHNPTAHEPTTLKAIPNWHYMGSTFPKGLLIAIEGIDGSGKTTLIKLITYIMRNWGLVVLATQEPTRGFMKGFKARSRDLITLSPKEQADAFTSDRRNHVSGEIKPALEKGVVVLTGRYVLSNVAYQGGAGGEGADSYTPQEIFKMNAFAPVPDLTLMLEVDLYSANSRITTRDQEDAFSDKESMKKHQEAYKLHDWGNIHRLDATRSIQEVFTPALKAIIELIEDRRNP